MASMTVVMRETRKAPVKAAWMAGLWVSQSAGKSDPARVEAMAAWWAARKEVLTVELKALTKAQQKAL